MIVYYRTSNSGRDFRVLFELWTGMQLYYRKIVFSYITPKDIYIFLNKSGTD